MSDELRVGMAGFGLAGRVFHGPLIATTPGLRISAVSTSNAERQADARRIAPDATIVGSVDDLLACELDVLVVITPHSSHVELAGGGLDAGLAVVVDKPLAVEAADAEALVARGGRLTVYQNRRWDGDFLTVRAMVDSGALGELTRFESRYDRFVPAVATERWRESDEPGLGGGVLLDFGAHLIDQALLIGGPVARVYCETDRRRPAAKVEDDVYIGLEHAAGLHSQLWASAVAPAGRIRFRVSGTEAGIVTRDADPQWDQLASGMTPGDAGYGVIAPGTFADARGRRALPIQPGRWQAFYEAVVAWVRDDAPAPVDPADSLAGLRVIDAARVAARERRVVELSA